MGNRNLFLEIQNEASAYKNVLAFVSDEDFNAEKITGKWSMAQLLEHVDISNKSAYLAILKPGELQTYTEKKDSVEKIEMMLNYNGNGWIAPVAAEPKGNFTSALTALSVFQKTIDRILATETKLNLQSMATGFAHPRLGYLSCGQWLEFVVWHMQHHYKQLLALQPAA